MPENHKRMTRDEFLLEIDEILGLQPGTLRGDEKLEELKDWDSTALINAVVLAEESSDKRITPDQVIRCSTVADLLRLADADSISSSQRSGPKPS